ncbi:MAG: DUF4038 domain-containing protein [Bryobacterales bacterium]
MGGPFSGWATTAWLMFKRLTREEADDYLEDRRRKGFNVIQAMVLHGADDANAYGAAALVDEDPGQPKTTPGADWMKEGEYDFWDHVDWVVEKAAEKELFVAMVAAWGSNARSGKLNEGNVEAYTRFLAERYGDRPNIIWVTGGDTQGDRETTVWQTMGRLFKQLDPDALVTFHPFGRTRSSYLVSQGALARLRHVPVRPPPLRPGRFCLTLVAKTTGATSRPTALSSRPSPPSTASPPTKAFRKACTTPKSPTGPTPTPAATPGGPSSPGPPATPTATPPSCRCTSRSTARGPMACARPGTSPYKPLAPRRCST